MFLVLVQPQDFDLPLPLPRTADGSLVIRLVAGGWGQRIEEEKSKRMEQLREADVWWSKEGSEDEGRWRLLAEMRRRLELPLVEVQRAVWCSGLQWHSGACERAGAHPLDAAVEQEERQRKKAEGAMRGSEAGGKEEGREVSVGPLVAGQISVLPYWRWHEVRAPQGGRQGRRESTGERSQESVGDEREGTNGALGEEGWGPGMEGEGEGDGGEPCEDVVQVMAPMDGERMEVGPYSVEVLVQSRRGCVAGEDENQVRVSVTWEGARGGWERVAVVGRSGVVSVEGMFVVPGRHEVTVLVVDGRDENTVSHAATIEVDVVLPV